MYHSKERQQEGAEINASLHALKDVFETDALPLLFLDEPTQLHDTCFHGDDGLTGLQLPGMHPTLHHTELCSFASTESFLLVT